MRSASSSWLLLGAVVLGFFVLALVLLRPTEEQAQVLPPTPPPQVPTAPAVNVPKPVETPKQRADSLFNAAMQASEAGESARASEVIPLALDAYQKIEGLDSDALFHVALLRAASGDQPEARATAERILAKSPDHLLALSVAARASDALGDQASARRYYERVVAVYPAESAKRIPEYVDHSRLLPVYRTEAERALGRK